jgi:hypothetical protein
MDSIDLTGTITVHKQYKRRYSATPTAVNITVTTKAIYYRRNCKITIYQFTFTNSDSPLSQIYLYCRRPDLPTIHIYRHSHMTLAQKHCMLLRAHYKNTKIQFSTPLTHDC